MLINPKAQEIAHRMKHVLQGDLVANEGPEKKSAGEIDHRRVRYFQLLILFV